MQRPNIFLSCIVLFIFSAWIGVNYFGLGKKPNQYQQFLGQKIILDGYVVSDPQRYVFGQQRFEIIPETQFSQKILVTASDKTGYAYGDKVYLLGKIKAPHNTKDRDNIDYMAAQNIYAEISAPQIFVVGKGLGNPLAYVSFEFKHFIYKRFQKYLPPEQSALLMALIINQKDLMSKNDINAFNVAGVAHLIAITGFILTLLLVFTYNLSPYVGKGAALILCLTLAIINIVITNFAAGVIRAAVMTGIYLLSKHFGRQYQVLPALGLTAALLITNNPLIVKYDLGFLLSFVAILGMVLYIPLFEIMFSGLPLPEHLKEIFFATLAAQIITAPLVIYYFKQISLIGPLTNLVLIPLVPATLWLGYSLCVPLLAALTARALLAILNFILLTVFGLAQFKYANIAVSIGPGAFVGLYIAQLLLYLLGSRMLLQLKKY